LGGTLTRVATIPSWPFVVSTSIGPTAESRVSGPTPTRSARATADAMVACPQNGTSAIGAKYRTRAVAGPVGVRNAVSE